MAWQDMPTGANSGMNFMGETSHFLTAFKAIAQDEHTLDNAPFRTTYAVILLDGHGGGPAPSDSLPSLQIPAVLNLHQRRFAVDGDNIQGLRTGQGIESKRLHNA